MEAYLNFVFLNCSIPPLMIMNNVSNEFICNISIKIFQKFLKLTPSKIILSSKYKSFHWKTCLALHLHLFVKVH